MTPHRFWPVVLVLFAVAVRLPAQVVAPPAITPTGALTELRVLLPPPSGAWIELTPLSSEEPPSFYDLSRRRSDDTVLTLDPGWGGAAMLCTGAIALGVRCEEVFLRSPDDPLGEDFIAVGFEPGLLLTGALRIGRRAPVAGAQVAVVPAELRASRPFTLPLRHRRNETMREVPTGEDGRFNIPQLAAGRYFLEVLLPSGRIHRTDPFEVPDAELLRRERGVVSVSDLIFELGVFDVDDGLVMQVVVTRAGGGAVPGAEVRARQGRTARDLISYQAHTGRDGAAWLGGFLVELPVEVDCQADGYHPVHLRYDLVPVTAECDLEPWARVYGEVLGPDSRPWRGMTVSIGRIADDELGDPPGTPVRGPPGEPSAAGPPAALETVEAPGIPVRVPPRAAPPKSVPTDARGGFSVDQLRQGSYRLIATAPGFEPEERRFALDAGERLDLGTLFLSFGRVYGGRVVDAETGAELAGVEVSSVDPPGAVDETSDVDGTFLFTVAGERSLVLSFAAPDYTTRRLTVDSADLEDREPLLVELDPAGWIMVVAFDPVTGRRCRGCRIAVHNRDSAAVHQELTTDSLGEALSGPLGKGFYRLSETELTHLGSTVIEQPEAEYQWARVTPGNVTVVRLGPRGQRVRVRFDRHPAGASFAVWTLSARTKVRFSEYYPDEDGAFPVEIRRGEHLELFLHTQDSESGSEVEVRQGTLPASFRDEELTLRLPATRIRGQADSLVGPVAGERVQLRSLYDGSFQAAVATGKDGRFEIPHAPPGLYSLMIGDQTVKFVRVSDHETVELGTFHLLPENPEIR